MPTGPRPRPPAGSVRLAVTGVNGALPWANVMWLKTTGPDPPSGTDLNSLANFCGDAWAVNLISHMGTFVVVENSHVSFYGSALEQHEGNATLNLTGGAVGSEVPAQCAVGVTWLLNVGYRGGHPRNYIPGLTVAQMDGLNTITIALANTLAAGANTFRNNVNGYTNPSFTSVQLVCMSFVRQNQWRATPVPLTITGAHVDLRIDTIRHRLGPDQP